VREHPWAGHRLPDDPVQPGRLMEILPIDFILLAMLVALVMMWMDK
jgi:hypothetical protein